MFKQPAANLRLAVIRKVSKTFIECEYLNHSGERSFKCPVPHPFVQGGGGFLVGLQPGATVLVSEAPAEQKFVVGFVALKKDYFEQEGLDGSVLYNTPIPELAEGEILIKSNVSNSSIDFLPEGNIMIDVGAGNSEADLELSSISKTMYARVKNKYDFTEAGRQIEGIVKRDKNKSEDESIANSMDLLSSDIYDDFLSQIGRSPTDEVQNRTTTIIRDFVRNPALVEKRQITYEYADSFGVRNISAEASAMMSTSNTIGSENLVKPIGRRPDRRTDVFNLNMFNYNHLIERIEGTAVDIYGNVLDINRNIVKIPDVTTLDTKKGNADSLKNLYRYMRRSIKYHMEINSRKELNGDEPSRKTDAYARDHSRWSIDVDGEGLTKVNIPASTNTGNIPLLTRYVNSVPTDSGGNILSDDRESGSYRDEGFIDVKGIQFGAKNDGYGPFVGQKITNSEYSPRTFDKKTIATAGTAYHDLINIAPLIFSSGKLRNPNPSEGAKSVPPVSRTINNKIGSNSANAGGKSVHANLDGSMELSIGADNIDGKSLIMDLQGAALSHFGKDKNGRSLIHHSDGDVIIQVGGEGIDDTGERPGRVEIHLARGDGVPQKLIIDENGITLDIQGNAVFSSTGDFTVSSGGRLLLNGELIFNYGSFDTSIDGTRKVTGSERLVIRDGRPIY